MNSISRLCLAFLASLLIPVSALSQSVFTFDLILTKGDAVLLSGVDDWNFGQFGATATSTSKLSILDTTCVFSSTGGYSLEFTSTNGTNSLHMVNGTGDTLRYNVRVTYRDGARFRTRRITAGTRTLTGMSGSSQIDCGDEVNIGWNLQLETIIRKNNFNNAVPGYYSDVVTLMVKSE